MAGGVAGSVGGWTAGVMRSSSNAAALLLSAIEPIAPVDSIRTSDASPWISVEEIGVIGGLAKGRAKVVGRSQLRRTRVTDADGSGDHHVLAALDRSPLKDHLREGKANPAECKAACDPVGRSRAPLDNGALAIDSHMDLAIGLAIATATLPRSREVARKKLRSQPQHRRKRLLPGLVPQFVQSRHLERAAAIALERRAGVSRGHGVRSPARAPDLVGHDGGPHMTGIGSPR